MGDKFGERFWLRHGSGPWREVDKAEYVRVERQAGFHNTMNQPDEPATASFGGLRGDQGTTLNPWRPRPGGLAQS